VPKNATPERPAPAVLCLHPTEDSIGHKVIVGLGGKPHRQYAAELAERGYITLSPSYVQLAQYQPDLKALGYISGSMKAIWDNIRALDYLETLPAVRRDKGFAAIGHSLGGHNAIYTAVLDPRIQVIVSSCGFDSYTDYKGGNLTGWCQQRYMPAMADYLGHPQDVPFDFYELIACLAPRRLFVNAPLRDDNFKHHSVDRIIAAAQPVYQLFSGAGRITVMHPDSEHDFPDDVRGKAYATIQLGLGAARE
jgi:pimeloyl-ACP methyl ester carboxylesterase